MRSRTTIVRVAEWPGWCGACADERPLVLTRAGRHSLRSWLTGSGAERRPLTLTCRLCGVGVAVPPEADDPEVVLDERLAAPGSDGGSAGSGVAAALVPAGAPHVVPADAQDPVPADASHLAVPPATVPPLLALAAPAPAQDPAQDLAPALSPVPSSALVPVAAPAVVAPSDLHGARRAVGSVLAALLQARATAAQEPVTAPLPPLPVQRSGEPPAAVDGLHALQLLAEGLDLLSPSPS